MKPHDYLAKIKKSKVYQEFMKEDSGAYLCSLFFIRDFEEKKSETQVDFYSPKIKKIVSFKADKKVERIPLDKKAENLKHEKFVPKRINDKTNLDLDKLKSVLLDEMHNRGITDEIKKMLIILHNMDERDVWNSTCFLRGLGLLQAHVEDESESVLFMERKSFFDMIKFVGKDGIGGVLGGNPENVPGKSPVKNIKIVVDNPDNLKIGKDIEKSSAKSIKKFSGKK